MSKDPRTEWVELFEKYERGELRDFELRLAVRDFVRRYEDLRAITRQIFG